MQYTFYAIMAYNSKSLLGVTDMTNTQQQQQTKYLSIYIYFNVNYLFISFFNHVVIARYSFDIFIVHTHTYTTIMLHFEKLHSDKSQLSLFFAMFVKIQFIKLSIKLNDPNDLSIPSFWLWYSASICFFSSFHLQMRMKYWMENC